MRGDGARARRAGRVVAAALAAIAVASGASAQSAARATRSPSAASVRAELASVLLQSRRYDEAAREYRALLRRSPRSAEYRLGLARALAWGNHPREAEAELRAYRAQHGATASVTSLLMAVRDAYEPSASEASRWVAEQPGYAPYRLALARALARERFAFVAAAQYDTLLWRAGEGSVPSRSALLREKADAYVRAGSPGMAAQVVAQSVAAAPGDTAMRHNLAQLLVAADRSDAALEQYDALIGIAPTGGLYRERADLHLVRHEPALAEADLRASLRIAPSAAAWRDIGDIRRDAGDYDGARAAYASAAALPGLSAAERRSVLASQARLAREQHPGLLVPVVGLDGGWSVSSDFASDNQGLRYNATEARRGMALDGGFSAGVDAGFRSLGGPPAPVSGAALERNRDVSNGVAAHGALGWEAGLGALLVRALARAGGVVHEGAGGAMAELGASALLAVNRFEGALELVDAPAYPTLLTVASLVSPGEAPLRERSVAATVGAPAGPVDVGASWQRSMLSDGNVRTSGEGYARLPIGGPLSALYHGSVTTFAERSSRYWDPMRYTSHAVGAEASWRRTRGLSAAVRVLPEYARSRELVAPPAVADTAWDGSIIVYPQPRSIVTDRSAFQLGASGEVSWRANGWELAAGVAHGRGRAGSYQSTAATVTLRLAR